jgi:hypothetical protein
MVVEALVPSACNLYFGARRGERRYNASTLQLLAFVRSFLNISR